jgi:hypothetical protein
MTAGLLTRSLYLLFHNYPGFDGSQILSARLRPLPGAYRDPAFNNGLTYYPLLLERIAALPGVRSVGYARAFGNADRDDTGRGVIGFVGTPPSDLTAQLDVVSPGFFETVGIPILQGRGPRWSDRPDAPVVAFVSASLARALGGDVIGKHVWFAFGDFQNVEIVGVVGDASLGNLRSPAPPVFYVGAAQLGSWGFYSTLQIAASGDPWLLVNPLQDTLRGLGREYAYSITTLDKRLQQNAVNERMGATLATPVAGLAALLAFVGIKPLRLRRRAPHARDRRAPGGRRHARRGAADGAARERDAHGDWCRARYPHRHHGEPRAARLALRRDRIGSAGCGIRCGVLPDAHDRGGAHSRASRGTSGSRSRSPRRIEIGSALPGINLQWPVRRGCTRAQGFGAK